MSYLPEYKRPALHGELDTEQESESEIFDPIAPPKRVRWPNQLSEKKIRRNIQIAERPFGAYHTPWLTDGIRDADVYDYEEAERDSGSPGAGPDPVHSHDDVVRFGATSGGDERSYGKDRAGDAPLLRDAADPGPLAGLRMELGRLL